MYKLVRKLLVMLLLLAIPLQGLSAVLMPFHCLTDDPHQEASVSAPHEHAHSQVAHEHGGNFPATDAHHGDTPSKDAGNSCCNHVCTGVPSVAIFAAPDTPFVYENHISVIPPLFFPEQFLRPPRT